MGRSQEKWGKIGVDYGYLLLLPVQLHSGLMTRISPALICNRLLTSLFLIA